MFCSPQATWKKTGLSVSLENTSQKMFIGNDRISEIVCDSDSDGGNFSELSDDMCKVNSPFISSSSRSEEQEVFEPEPGRGQEENTQGPSAGLLELASNYSYPTCSFCSNVSG
jgi:hypothetical protein